MDDIVLQAQAFIQQQMCRDNITFSDMKELLEIQVQIELVKLIRVQKCESLQETVPRFVT